MCVSVRSKWPSGRLSRSPSHQQAKRERIACVQAPNTARSNITSNQIAEIMSMNKIRCYQLKRDRIRERTGGGVM